MMIAKSLSAGSSEGRWTDGREDHIAKYDVVFGSSMRSYAYRSASPFCLSRTGPSVASALIYGKKLTMAAHNSVVMSSSRDIRGSDAVAMSRAIKRAVDKAALGRSSIRGRRADGASTGNGLIAAMLVSTKYLQRAFDSTRRDARVT